MNHNISISSLQIKWKGDFFVWERRSHVALMAIKSGYVDERKKREQHRCSNGSYKCENFFALNEPKKNS